MSYASSLKWLRCYLQCPWLDSPPEIPVSNYTAHSLKCSLLSFMLELPEIQGSDRDAQGPSSTAVTTCSGHCAHSLSSGQQFCRAFAHARRNTGVPNYPCSRFPSLWKPFARRLMPPHGVSSLSMSAGSVSFRSVSGVELSCFEVSES